MNMLDGDIIIISVIINIYQQISHNREHAILFFHSHFSHCSATCQGLVTISVNLSMRLLIPGPWALVKRKHLNINSWTHKHWETHGCLVSTVATDALVLKHQAISIHNAD